MPEKNKRKIEYDPKHTMSYGYWTCPECKSSFYGGGRAMHNEGCSLVGYANCIYHFGPKEVKKTKEWAKSQGEDNPTPVGELTLREMREQFPELVK